MKADSILPLLAKLQERNSRDDLFVQKVAPPEPFDLGIPVLKRGEYRRPSPMIRERMEYAGDWANAFPSTKWLGISSMERVWTSRKLKAQIELRRQNWERSIVAKSDLIDLSLLGVDLVEMKEIYLHWGSAEEPRVLFYTSGEEKKYRDLGTFVRAILSGR